MANSREVKVAVVGDASQLQKVMAQAGGHVDDFGKQASKAGDILQSALFGSAAILGAKKLVDSAAELQQSIGGTAAVFEDASGSVSDFSKNAAELAGLSENAARTLTARLGASLKGFGLSSEEAAQQAVFLTQTGADLAATLGGTTDEAVTALGAALRGEFDPLERFGIALKATDVATKAVQMGLAESTTDVSNYAKGQAALALITEKSAFAQGQFARESDTAAGAAQIANAKAQNASADLGKALLPIYTKIVEAVSAVTDVFASLPGPVQTGALALGGVALFAKPAYDAIRSVVDVVKAAPAFFDDLAIKLGSSKGMLDGFGQTAEMTAGKTSGLTSNFGALLAGGALVGAGIYALTQTFSYYSDQQQNATAALKDYKDALNSSNASQEDAIATTTANRIAFGKIGELAHKSGADVKVLANSILGGSENLSKYSDEVRKVGSLNYFKEQAAQGGELAAQIVKIIESNKLNLGEQIKLVDSLLDEKTAADKAIESGKTQNDVKAAFTGETKKASGSSQDFASKLKTEADKAKEAAKALKELYDTTVDYQGLLLTAEERQIATNKALEEYKKSLKDGSLTADERKSKELDLTQALMAQAKTAAETAGAQAVLEDKAWGAGQAAKVQSDKLNELAQTLAPGNPVRKRLEDFAFQLFLVSLQDTTIRMELETKAAVEELKAFVELINGYGQGGTMELDAILAYSAQYPDRKAIGGPVTGNTPYMVGENGPELFMPSGMGRILTNAKTSALLEPLSQSAKVVNYNVNVTADALTDKAALGQAVVEAISKYEQRAGAGWRS